MDQLLAMHAPSQQLQQSPAGSGLPSLYHELDEDEVPLVLQNNNDQDILDEISDEQQHQHVQQQQQQQFIAAVAVQQNAATAAAPTAPPQAPPAAQSSSSQSSKKRKRFTKEEDELILKAIPKYENAKGVVDWDRLRDDIKIDRSKDQIKNRYQRIQKSIASQKGSTVVQASGASQAGGGGVGGPTVQQQTSTAQVSSSTPQVSAGGVVSSGSSSASSQLHHIQYHVVRSQQSGVGAGAPDHAAYISALHQHAGNASPIYSSDGSSIDHSHHSHHSHEEQHMYGHNHQTAHGLQAKADQVTRPQQQQQQHQHPPQQQQHVLNKTTPMQQHYSQVVPPISTTQGSMSSAGQAAIAASSSSLAVSRRPTELSTSPTGSQSSSASSSNSSCSFVSELDEPPNKRPKVTFSSSVHQDQHHLVSSSMAAVPGSSAAGTGGATFGNVFLDEEGHIKTNFSQAEVLQHIDFVARLQQESREKTEHAQDLERKYYDAQQRYSALDLHYKSELQKVEAYQTKYRSVLEQLVRDKAERERREEGQQLKEKCLRIGTISYERKGLEVFEVWQDGEAFIELEKKMRKLQEDKEALERAKRSVAKRRQNLMKKHAEQQQQQQQQHSPPPPALTGSSSTSSTSSSASSHGGSGSGATTATTPTGGMHHSASMPNLQLHAHYGSSTYPSSYSLQYGHGHGHGGLNQHQHQLHLQQQADMQDEMNAILEQEETLRLRTGTLKKEESQINEDKRKLLIEKNQVIREIKRNRDQERSRFNNFPVLQDRYLLIKMLGRGGFSEVYKAYDLREMRTVACKIHQLSVSWKEHRKENYIRHVLRECQIHKSIRHEHIVQMHDTFIYDNNTFVTVLEFCQGADLDNVIKTQQRIPEREARNIISQVFSGLKYLNTGTDKRIIHFDLKPANILFHDGQVKITDFGLSKILSDEDDGIELTSQGAGTYWYLPPECFEMGPSVPRISSKVDVWSAGVVFYQMLYGKKPFGNDLSQQKILTEQTIINARHVQFPPKPFVSEDAKEFIRACLTHEQSKRPDVLQAYNHSYLRQDPFGVKQGGASSATATAAAHASSSYGGAPVTPTSTTGFAYLGGSAGPAAFPAPAAKQPSSGSQGSGSNTPPGFPFAIPTGAPSGPAGTPAAPAPSMQWYQAYSQQHLAAAAAAAAAAQVSAQIHHNSHHHVPQQHHPLVSSVALSSLVPASQQQQQQFEQMVHDAVSGNLQQQQQQQAAAAAAAAASAGHRHRLSDMEDLDDE